MYFFTGVQILSSLDPTEGRAKCIAAAAAVMNEGGAGESATTAAAEEEEIARVLNEFCASELFSEDTGMTTTDDNNEGDEDEGDEEERTRIADKQEVLPHYIA